MSKMSKTQDALKEKFRPDESALDQELAAALEGISTDELLATNAPQRATGSRTPGGPQRGVIARVTQEEVFVDFGGKSQGVCSLLQFDDIPSVGQEMDFLVERYDVSEGLLILNRKGALASKVTWENLEVGQIVEGIVTGVNKGGLELEIKGMRAFMPAGQVEIFHVPDLNQFIGHKMQAEVTAADRATRNIVLSRRNILEREKAAQKEKLLEELTEGQTRRGTIRSIQPFGAFVDLGGVDGLLHVSEMSWRRVRDPNELVKVGDVVDVKIIKIDREAGKLSLSLKEARPDPWLSAADRYGAGSLVTGRVTRLESFGAFIEIEEGVEGLLPISEMSWQRIKHPGDIVKEGDTIKLVVLSMDPVARKLSFSLKQAGEDPWTSAADRYPRDTVVSGTVTRIADFGAFVEVETGIEGLVHISELSAQRVRAVGDVVKVGQQVSARVLEVDRQTRRLSLSIKRAAESATTAPAAPPAPVLTEKQKKKKEEKRKELRGGLDF